MYWWENTFLKAENNRLKISGRDTADLAEEFGTPLFIYSRSQVLENLSRLQNVFSRGTDREIRICYAMKANYHKDLLSLLQQQGIWIDAVSPGEVAKALEAGFPQKRIIYTGTSVSQKDLEQIFRFPELIFNIDAEEQLNMMIHLKNSASFPSPPRISIRWNPGLGRGFSPKTITAGARSSDGTPIKFGIEEDRVEPVLRKAVEAGFSPVGLHQHLGSGWIKQDFEYVKQAVDRMLCQAALLRQRGYNFEFLDFGGGFGPRYFEDQTIFPLEKYAEHIKKGLDKSEIPAAALAIEPGKFLIGDAGVLLLRVEYIKSSYGNNFACVNGGTFNTVPRPAIYTQAQHKVINAFQIDSTSNSPITIAGNLCETGDVFAKEVPMPRPRSGDILALLCAGAYCRSMASNFNCRDIPQEIFL